jgi:hypothetical protein
MQFVVIWLLYGVHTEGGRFWVGGSGVLLGGSYVHHENGDGAAGVLLFYFTG